MKNLILTLIIFAFAAPAFAQFNGDNTVTLGDRAFKNKDYFEAAYYYKKAAEGLKIIGTQAIPYQATGKGSKEKKDNKSRTYVEYQLAESYRLYENYIEAEGWYARVIAEGGNTEYPLARLWHGVCLRATQKFDDAIAGLQQFKSGNGIDAKYMAIADKEIANCHFAKEQYKYPVLLDVVKKAGDWNSNGSDYSVVKSTDGFWFTSSRAAKDNDKRLNHIYMAADSAASPQMAEMKTEDDNKETEYGTPAFTADGSKMYFTRWFKDGSKTRHAIYMASREGQGWGAPQKLGGAVNQEGFNSIQPFVTLNGRRLYFISNKPGGQGGDDVWESELDAAGLPVNAVNLGVIVNTEFDEQAPYFDEQHQRLIYSSKGFIGLGGFDFFESFYKNGQWSVPQNMGYPFNSAKDDVYYYPKNSEGSKFFLSSDRESDCCLNIFEATDRRYVLAGIVTDCDGGKPLSGVKVTFIDSLSKKLIADTLTTANAAYAFKVTTRRPYQLRLEKSGYLTTTVAAPTAGNMRNDTLYNAAICMHRLVVDKPIVIPNVLYDFDKATLRPESKEVLDDLVATMNSNPKIRVELSAHTDSKGTDAYNLKLSDARAKSCVDYIISKGVSSDRIYARGYGESKPIALNTLADGRDNPAGRQLNRRTEFKVVKMDE